MPRRATGFIRPGKLADGSLVWDAQIRMTDGKRLRRKLGAAWTKRSRPPDGYLTRAQAEARLQAILAGNDPTVPIEPVPSVTFDAAGR